MEKKRKIWLREQLAKFSECQLFSFGSSDGFDVHSDVSDLLDENDQLLQDLHVANAALKMEQTAVDLLREKKP